MTLQQREVQTLLIREVAIEDGLGDAGRGRDIVQTGPVIAAFAEQAPGRLDDHCPTLGARQTLALASLTHVTDE